MEIVWNNKIVSVGIEKSEEYENVNCYVAF